MYALIVLAAVLFSLKGIFAKLALQAGMSIEVIMLYRYLIATPLVWLSILICLKRRGSSVTKKGFLWLSVAGFFGYYLGTKFDFIAVKEIGANISRFVLFVYPVFVVITQSMMQRKWPTVWQIVCLLLVQAGLFLTVGANFQSLAQLNIKGIGFGLLAAASFAIYILVVQKHGAKFKSLEVVSIALTAATSVIVVEAICKREVLNFEMNDGFIWVVCMAIFSTAVPLVIFAEAIKRVGGSIAAVVSATGPFITLVLAYFLLEETMEVIQIFGGLLIVCAISVFSRLKEKE